MFFLGGIEYEELKGIEPLSKEQLDKEMNERYKRKKHLQVHDLEPEKGRKLTEIMRLVNKSMNFGLKWEVVERTTDYTVVEVDNVNEKVEVVYQRYWFKEFHGLFFLDDRTPRELEIYDCLKDLADKERDRGNNVVMGHLRIRVNGTWKVWSERRGRLELEIGNRKRSRNH